MAQTVSNDALWEKLLEIDKKLEKLSVVQNSPEQEKEIEEIKAYFNEVKEEIILPIKTHIRVLGLSNDSHYAAHKQNIEILNENIIKTLGIVTRIRKQQREDAELLQEDKDHYFIFRFFKIRKTTLVIAILGLLVFILTLFCMKQQNDYSLLIDEFYQKNISIQEKQIEE